MSSGDSGDQLSVSESTIVLAWPSTRASHVSSSKQSGPGTFLQVLSQGSASIKFVISLDKISRMTQAWVYYQINQRMWIQGGVKTLAVNLLHLDKLCLGSDDRVTQS